MLKILTVVLLFLLPSLRAAAQDAVRASEASVKELMEVTQSRKMLDGMSAQMDAFMKSTGEKVLAGQKLTPEQEEIMADMRAKMIALMGEEMNWEKLEPLLVEVYEKSFTQQELDGMLAFYRSPSGQAVIVKMPVVMQYSMQLLQKQLVAMAPKIQQEAATRLRETIEHDSPK